jgi:hypothetical protein
MNPTLPEHVIAPDDGRKASGGILIVTNQLGQKFHLHINSAAEAYAKMRILGTQGWSTDIPPGGIILPYAMADCFDWSLIGARPYEFNIIDDGQPVKKHAVEYRGESYKRRDNPAKKEKGVNYPDMISYSRGGKSTDPDHIKESRSEVVKDGYVTLITFRGKGPLIPAFMKP